MADQRSHFDGKIKESSKYHAEIVYTDFSRPEIQIMSARETHAYDQVQMQRTTAYITTDFLQYPLIVDLFKATSETTHQYDLPFWYGGHMISLSFPYEKALTQLEVMGEKQGYEHLWREAWGKNTTSNTTTFTWLQRDKFYSLSTATTPETELYMVRAGANDPDYHLRSEGAFLVREKGRTNHTFATALETHGTYDLQVEQSANLTASCREVKVLYDTPEATIVRVSFKEGQQVTLCVAWEGDADRRYRIKAEGERFEWKGAYHLVQKK